MTSPETRTGRDEEKNDSIRKKLENLRQFMPGQHETVYRFASFLSTRIQRMANAGEFDRAALNALCELQFGKDALSGEPLQNQDALVGLPPKFYIFLKNNCVPMIKEVIFGTKK